MPPVEPLKARRHSTRITARYHRSSYRYSPLAPVLQLFSRGRRCLSEPSMSFRHLLRFRFRFRLIPSSPSPHSLSGLHIAFPALVFFFSLHLQLAAFVCPSAPSSFVFCPLLTPLGLLLSHLQKKKKKRESERQRRQTPHKIQSQKRNPCSKSLQPPQKPTTTSPSPQ